MFIRVSLRQVETVTFVTIVSTFFTLRPGGHLIEIFPLLITTNRKEKEPFKQQCL